MKRISHATAKQISESDFYILECSPVNHVYFNEISYDLTKVQLEKIAYTYDIYIFYAVHSMNKNKVIRALTISDIESSFEDIIKDFLLPKENLLSKIKKILFRKYIKKISVTAMDTLEKTFRNYLESPIKIPLKDLKEIAKKNNIKIFYTDEINKKKVYSMYTRSNSFKTLKEMVEDYYIIKKSQEKKRLDNAVKKEVEEF